MPRVFFWTGAAPEGDGIVWELVRIGLHYYKIHVSFNEWQILGAAPQVLQKVAQTIADAIPEFK